MFIRRKYAIVICIVLAFSLILLYLFWTYRRASRIIHFREEFSIRLGKYAGVQVITYHDAPQYILAYAKDYVSENWTFYLISLDGDVLWSRSMPSLEFILCENLTTELIGIPIVFHDVNISKLYVLDWDNGTVKTLLKIHGLIMFSPIAISVSELVLVTNDTIYYTNIENNETRVLLENISIYPRVKPSLVDIDLDSCPELLLVTYGGALAVELNGTILWENKIGGYEEPNETPFPYITRKSVTPIVLDTDSDREQEIIIVMPYAVICMLASNGSIIWSINTTEPYSLYTPPIVGDVDLDSETEIIVSFGINIIAIQNGEIEAATILDGGMRYMGVGDINSDGLYEIICIVSSPRSKLVVFGSKLNIRFQREVYSINIAGDVIPPGAYLMFFQMCICDIDNDGSLEIFTGYQSFEGDGGVIPLERNFSWFKIANFDTDPSIEMISIETTRESTTIYLLDILEGGIRIFWQDNTMLPEIDPDLDTLSTYTEYIIGTDPSVNDTDNDGMPDGWEYANHLDPSDPTDSIEDTDGDGLDNIAEYKFRGDPLDSDTDDDGLSDYDEAQIGTDLRLNDTDGDGYSDGYEVSHGTDPLDPDDYPASLIVRYWWVPVACVAVIVVFVVFSYRRGVLVRKA